MNGSTQPVETYWDIVWKQFRNNRSAYAALWALVPLVAVAIFAPLICSNLPLVFWDGIRAEDFCHNDFIGERQAASQILLQNSPPQGVRAWFKNYPEPRCRIARSQSFQRSSNCRGMMREVVNDGDAVHLRFPLQPPLHALESLQRRRDFSF